MAIPAYVKFMRGTPTAFTNLNTKDADVLYFISEENATSGKLYLGNKLISGSTGVSGDTTLADLEDVIIGAGITNNSLLVYNDQTRKWTAESLSEVLSVIVATMTGATQTTDGTSGLVPTPTAGDLDRFLKVDGTWAKIDISTLETQVATLIDTDTGKSVREIANEELVKALIPEDAQESLDSLKEIADWIQDHPAEAAKMNTDIIDLKSSVADLESTVGTFSTIVYEGSSYTNLSDIVTVNTQSITQINERLTWNSLDK